MKSLFVAANLLIAIDYALIGWLLFRRLWEPVRKWRNRTFAATGCMAMFFLLCVHTHVDLLLMEPDTFANPHWYSWWNVTSHVAQGVFGLVFWYLARKHLTIRIYDRKIYDAAGDPDTERRLQYLAYRAGLR